MPAPMPPQGAPDPQAGAPQPQAPAQDQSGGSVGEVVGSIQGGLQALAGLMQKAKLPPEDLQKLMAISKAFDSLIEDLSDGGQDEAQEQAPQGPVPQESGGKGQPLPPGA